MSAVGGQRPRQRDKSLNRNVFGARGRVKAGRREQRRHIGAERAQALAEHFASLAECGLGYVLEQLCGRKAAGAGRGTRRSTEDVTFGGGTNADGLTSKRMRASQRHCVSTDNRP